MRWLPRWSNGIHGNARAQFALGYVFRYAGLLDEAAAQCEAALDRDPTDRRFRSCGIVFLRLGEIWTCQGLPAPRRAVRSSRLPTRRRSSSARGILRPLLEALRKLPDDYAIRGEALLRSCLERRSPSEIAAIARQIQSAAQTEPDPEQVYFAATSLAVCGRAEEAIQLLHQAIRGNYCSYPSLMTDPSWRRSRTIPILPAR